ncbi:MAG TPA: S8 family serine peptidase [Opitutaceae bacterium]
MRKLRLVLIFLALGSAALVLWVKFTHPAPPPPTAERLSSPATPFDSARAATSAGVPAGDHRALLTLLRSRLRKRDAREQEALLAFADAAARERFLARAAAAGLTVLGSLEGLNTVRVRYASLDDLARELQAHAGDYAEVGANALVRVPAPPPEAQERAARLSVPVGDRLLQILEATGDNSAWGRGVTIAILDSGVAADTTFGSGRLRTLDVGQGTRPGTAATAAAESRGVAPSADLLSIRVTDAAGVSDTFTVAQAIVAAADAGARVINVSLGTYQSSSLLTQAIDYAYAQGAVIVAAAGNDQAAQLAWPAADPRVVSVGATDARGEQVLFSNSGDQLKLTAPGYGITTAGAEEQLISFSGTSASAPVVAGAIAALMSATPNLTAAQAVDILQTHASDAGPAGADADYGQGVLNLGWSLARLDPTRTDTAIASQAYAPASGALSVVVQNRSARPAAGLTLTVDVGGTASQATISWLDAGASTTLTVQVDTARLREQGHLPVRSDLANTTGITDAVPANNQRTGVITAPVD